MMNNKAQKNVDGFAFASLIDENVCDALIIKENPDALCVYEEYFAGSRTLEECIEYVNNNKIEIAIIIGNDLSFLNRCPSIKRFVFYLNTENRETPKMSYLSKLRGIKSFGISGFDGIDKLSINGTSPLLFQKLKTLKYLSLCSYDVESKKANERISTFEDFDLPKLVKLSASQCNISSLEGIQNCPSLQWINLDYMKNLADISSLATLAPTLRALCIDHCPKITDFSVISKLNNLEYLELRGKNEIPSLDFIKNLPNLKLINLSMNVLDGDFSALKNVRYADVICKRHYNLKNKDLPKDRTDLGFEFI